jgi:DNA-directed RNA polymerase specialized sigma24 family protein
MPERETDKFWEKAFVALVNIARSRGAQASDAEDLAQNALVATWAEKGERGDLRAFVLRAAASMRQNASNERRATRRREDKAWLAEAAERTSPLRRTPEDLASVRERKTKLLDELFERTASDTACRGILNTLVAGFETPAEQARELSMPLHDVRNARRRLARLANELAERDGGSEERLGWGLGEPMTLGDEEVEP